MNRPTFLAAASRAASLCLVPACLALAGCVGAPAVIAPRSVVLAGPGPMPPPRPERIPPRPHQPERLVWEPGHYLQDQVGYTWHPGHYVAQPAPHLRFVHGRWERRGAGWTWVPGRWV
jgi:hypothetical protein